MEEQIELKFELISKISTIYLSVIPECIDLSRINYYSQKFNEDFEKYDLRKIGDETYRAISLLTDYKRVACEFYEYVRLQCEKERAISYFQRAPLYLKSHDIKYSGTACDTYVEMDEFYLNLKNILNQWNVFKNWIDDKRKDFLEKHLWVKKKIDEGNKDFLVMGANR